MNKSTKRFAFLRIIYFILTYVYVSSWLLWLEIICGTRPNKWSTTSKEKKIKTKNIRAYVETIKPTQFTHTHTEEQILKHRIRSNS